MRHVLIVANQTLVGGHLHERVEHILAVDPETRFHIVVPATGANGPDPARALAGARRRLSQAFEALDDIGARVTGEVGPAHPVVAVNLAIDRLNPDLIVLSTLPAGASRWLHLDLPHRLQRRFGVPVEHVTAESQSVDRAGAFEPPVVHTPDDTVHVLLAEENQHDVDVITMALAEAGTRNQLRVAHDGANALSFMRAVGPSEVDLVLFDLKLPVVTGFDLLAEIRAADEFDKVMMVALTTDEAADDRARAYDLGADAFVMKRPDYSQMAHVIDDLLAEVAG
ncbi:MAG: response regulator [Acidimicrobiaceae bacterium]|uniref:response regulator n=1 Tax=Candidatus Poriferisodalis multihospitum TaxID=2983191 RepID=UPI00137D4CB8|nr:response regulator [Candidatus Poriferisodalis multihospitum]MCY3585002.1 response regulator [Acidimicrobiaceae bacterium]MXY02960.1 response regulator [Acidimicrobiales bacterium]MCY3609296.1 response regulator [Acidimicrobiaceae bacterium]MCY3949799.1 response regulator [Acidimicrobiaceae bacterium]MDE0133574.1 response regulator [Acidimicrobiaceae bacterium]